MPDKHSADGNTIGAWTKRCYFAARAVMDEALRPYDLGATQWYVLYQLAHAGPTRQRELQRSLSVERATLSSVVITLVRKQLVEQIADTRDQRQKLLRLTETGKTLWRELPDLTRIHSVAFDGMDADDIHTTIRVLQAATERLERQLGKES
ncbi:MarR family transcriptional regulator [Mycobacterium sp. MBM]|nr:MarR family transcriptional regulator [Mycobacterium sp. MBM]